MGNCCNGGVQLEATEPIDNHKKPVAMVQSETGGGESSQKNSNEKLTHDITPNIVYNSLDKEEKKPLLKSRSNSTVSRNSFKSKEDLPAGRELPDFNKIEKKIEFEPAVKEKKRKHSSRSSSSSSSQERKPLLSDIVDAVQNVIEEPHHEEEIPAEEPPADEEIPAEEPPADDEIPAEEPPADEEPPVEEEPPAEEDRPAEEEPPAEEDLPAEEEPPVEEELPSEAPPVEDELPAEEEPPVEDELPAEEEVE